MISPQGVYNPLRTSLKNHVEVPRDMRIIRQVKKNAINEFATS